MENYDLVVVGSGPGGYIAAAEAAKKGLKTAIIEKGAYGGVCLNVGCIPTKTLLKSSKIYNSIRHAEDYGITIKDIAKHVIPNWAKMQERKAGVVKKLNGAVQFLMRSNKVKMYNGVATAVNNQTVAVGDEQIGFKNLIIATGSEPRALPLPGFAEARQSGLLVNSTGALALTAIPKEMVLIGGGVIGSEFACLFSELGTKVTILEGLPTILSLLDQDVIKEMTKIFTKKGITIHTGVKVKKIENNKVFYEDNTGKENSIAVDICLEAIGRVPRWDGFESLNLEKTPNGGIKTNEYGQTNVSNVYAVGDVNGHVMLAHVASAEALAAVAKIRGEHRPVNYELIPNAMYTHPEVACVGITEQQAKERNISYRKAIFPLSNSGKALADGATEGFAKIIIGKEYQEVLGAHLISESATDSISEITVLMTAEGTVSEIVHAIHPHPTISESIYEAALNLD